MFFIQSLVPELTELTLLYLNFVTLARLKRNPTVKDEMHQKGFGNDVPAGFLTYPISQVADITAFKSNLIPVGEDQLPMIEQTNEIVRHINNTFHTDVLVECRALLSDVMRLPGTDGKVKMGKSTHNAIFLGDSQDIVAQKVMGMFTDPHHLKVEDPGNVEVNTVFKYLDAFDPDKAGLEALKAQYRAGGLGDVTLKKRLTALLEAELAPMRARREEAARHPDEVMNMLKAGSDAARPVAAQTLKELKAVFCLDYS
jgi:tryptophanyl-tRNA synthetase